MRWDEITETEEQEIPEIIRGMLLKLRKGQVAWLNAARLKEIFTFFPGWEITKSKFMKPSNGGYDGLLLREILPSISPYFKSYKKYSDEKIHLTAQMLKTKGSDQYENDEHGRKKDQNAMQNLRDRVYQELISISGKASNKWVIQDVQFKKYDYTNHGVWETYDVSFELTIQCSGYIISSPDGQHYEVFGDYKNGALHPHSFEMFFRWATENTNFMDSVLEILGMGAFEKKIDLNVPYKPPTTASKELKKVFELLTTMTNKIKEEQKKKLIALETNNIQIYQEEQKNENQTKLKILQRNPLIFRVFNRKGVLSDNWKNLVEASVQQSVDYMQNVFVYKNTQKLGSILTEKGNMLEPKILYISVNNLGLLTGSLEFKFSDKSSFRVDNSVVSTYLPSRFGTNYTYFYRFPTTFHDVVLPDGSRMKSPSEERMNEIFAKA